jgi:nitrogenase-stabilizing/protective protein
MDETLTLDEALDEMSTAEDFLGYFDVEFDQHVVHVYRLHILQRFHDYLGRFAKDADSQDDESRRGIYRTWLQKAYLDFIQSDAQTEKVFRVFQQHDLPEGGSTSFISIDRVFQ